MRVLLIHQAFALPNEPGGTRHYEFARIGAEKGLQFTVIGSQVSYMTGRQTASTSVGDCGDDKPNGLKIIKAGAFPNLHRSFVWRVVSFISFMISSVLIALGCGSFDVVVGTTPPIFQALSALIVARIRQRPFLLEVRDLWPEFAIEMGVLKSHILIRLSRCFEVFLYNQACHIIINSPAYRSYLLNKGVAERKITMIPNGVDADMFDPLRTGTRIRNKYKLNGKFVATYAGALGPANDIPIIIEAAARLRNVSDIQFFLVGDGKDRKKLESTARELDLDNVTFTGSIPKQEIPDVLAASDVCLATLKNIPMFKTTYPNKVFDYMAAGRPSILCIDGVIREVVDACDGGVFVKPGDAAKLAETVRHLSLNRTQARAMGQRARNHVVKHFDRRRQAEAFADLVLSLGR